MTTGKVPKDTGLLQVNRMTFNNQLTPGCLCTYLVAKTLQLKEADIIRIQEV